jgi:WD40 repeat protein
MDKTVRLWYTTMSECLRIFTHQDFVTSIQFNPLNDKTFISGSLDGKLRMWNIPDLKVVDWIDIGEMVTSCAFSPDGERVVVGTHRGKCHFYGVENGKFEYLRQMQVKNTRGRKSVRRKITGLAFQPGPDQNLLVTANDSRIRLYSGGDTVVKCKYKGHSNQSAQIKATFSHNGEFIISGSEQPDVFIWRAYQPQPPRCLCAGPTPKQRNYEKFSTKEQHVTAAIFAPEQLRSKRAYPLEELDSSIGQIIVAAGYTGELRVFENCARKRN